MNIILDNKYPNSYYDKDLINAYKRLIGDTIVKGFTLNNLGEIIETECKIASDNSYNYHNNYDDSKDVMYVKIGGNWIIQWFTLNKHEIEKVFISNNIWYKEQLKQKLPNHLKDIIKDE